MLPIFVYYSGRGSGETGTVVADASGSGSFTANAINSDFTKVELTQVVLSQSALEAPYDIVHDSIHRIKSYSVG